ncbi:MAG: thioredoxin domain-containing protein [Hyphomicrobiaceae bacterium]|nr:thioredoxin domain-containing protein [Hyphomicrobiaceae bacterium]
MSENRLGRETSPYLLQHKDNPVHWRAWGPEALAEARQANKPILLSVGYAACHWCHVMAHESFEDEATAAVMNDLFINIKVDREERPDIDAIYMNALHGLGEQGGWPLTMFLDTEARPFWGGTYFPPQPRWGKPSFQQVLREVDRIYREEPDKVRHNAELITDMLKTDGAAAGRVQITDRLLEELTGRMVRAIDPVHGGIQGAPKFPQWSFMWLLWRGAIRYGQEAARSAVELTLTRICQGGIYDHLGGGFARYAVDERWLVPHFEKMLYDNALLIDLMTEVYRETGNPLFRRRIEETVDWIEREMIAEGGGFAASLDADSEGEEGRFYVWTAAEVEDVLGERDARVFSEAYGVSPEGNWEGHNILNRLDALALRSDEDEAALAGMRARLLARRSGRVRPGWDDKVLADWNGLMIAALAAASCAFKQPRWRELAEQAFSFIEQRMIVDGRLVHSYRAGQAKAPATASDYANLTWAALRLCQATTRPRYLEAAVRFAAELDQRYWDEDAGGYFMTASDTPDVIVRMKSARDDATPNANAVMMTSLVQLFMLTGRTAYLERAEAIVDAFGGDLQRNLISHAGLLANAIDLISPQHVVVLSGGDSEAAAALEAALLGVSLPGAVQQFVEDTASIPEAAALAGKRPIEGKATAYVCIGQQCSAPLTDPEALRLALCDQRQAAPSSA